MDRQQVIDQLTAAGSPFEVTHVDVGGRDDRSWANAPTTLRALLESTAKHGDRDFIVYGEQRWTFTEHLALVAGIATWLRDIRGVRKGDRVAIGMRNYPEWIMAFWATQAIGAVAVPLNAWWVAPELRFALEDSGATLAVVDAERYERMGADLADLGIAALVVRSDGEVRPGDAHWHDVVDGLDPSMGLPDVVVDPGDDSTIMYTSGTTGRPKGAVATHRNHVSTFFNTAFTGTVAATMAKAQRSETTQDPGVPRSATSPCALLTYPFFHIGGLNTVCINTGFGIKVVLQYKWDLEDALKMIERERVTQLAAVPTLLRELLESPLLERYDVSSLGSIASGGGPVPPDLVARIDKTFASAVSPSNGYGLTETSGAVTLNNGAAYLDRTTSVGVPFPVTQVQVVDPESGATVDGERVGELWFRGPTVSRGYWNDAAATASAFSDGWFHTGDLGYVDGEGYVYVVDRMKDVIIRGGENIYCAEVEAVLFEHPAIADVAVVGVADVELGEQVAAVVRLHPGAEPSAAELQEHVAARLAYFKVPTHIVVRVAELPRNATGKVLKQELRDELDPTDR